MLVTAISQYSRKLRNPLGMECTSLTFPNSVEPQCLHLITCMVGAATFHPSTTVHAAAVSTAGLNYAVYIGESEVEQAMSVVLLSKI